MSVCDPVLMIVAHGPRRTGAVPGGMFSAHLQRQLPHFDIRLSFLRSTPSAGNVLKVMTRNSASDVLVFPLFFTPGAGLVAELSALVADARLEAEAPLPFAGHLSGYDRMLAARIAQRLKAGGNQKDKKAIFLVAHGQKQDICPSPEMQQLRAILSHHLDHDEIYNVQIDGQPSLANWRNMTRCRNALFVPLMTGDGAHCRIDIPASVNSRSDEKVGMLAPVGTWWELSSLLADHVNCGRHHRRSSFQPSQSARTEFGADHVTP